jgi:hypothetical protein
MRRSGAFERLDAKTVSSASWLAALIRKLRGIFPPALGETLPDSDQPMAEGVLSRWQRTCARMQTGVATGSSNWRPACWAALIGPRASRRDDNSACYDHGRNAASTLAGLTVLGFIARRGRGPAIDRGTTLIDGRAHHRISAIAV